MGEAMMTPQHTTFVFAVNTTTTSIHEIKYASYRYTAAEPSFVAFDNTLSRSLNGSFGFPSPRKTKLVPPHPVETSWARPLRLVRSVPHRLKLRIRSQLLLHIILDVPGLARGLTKRVVDVLPRRLGRLLHVGLGGGFLAWVRVSGAWMTGGLGRC
jgi:hypothetical protein